MYKTANAAAIAAQQRVTAQTEQLAWMNACGLVIGNQVTTVDSLDGLTVEDYLMNLRRIVFNELETIKQNLLVINIEDMKIWRKRRHMYKFLPKAATHAPKTTSTLKRWQHDMQIYVGAFEFLRQIQKNWDQHYQQMIESETTAELTELLASAKRILCEIESTLFNTQATIAATTATATATTKTKTKTKTKTVVANKLITEISRLSMNEILAGFRTIPNENAAHEADLIDLKFAKSFYFDFLKAMKMMLRHSIKRWRKTHANNNNNNNNNNIQTLQQQKQHQLHLLQFLNNDYRSTSVTSDSRANSNSNSNSNLLVFNSNESESDSIEFHAKSNKHLKHKSQHK